MTFFLKKLIGSLLMPMPLGALLLLVGLLLTRWERRRRLGMRLAVAGLAVVWNAGLPLTAHLLVAPLEAGMDGFEPDGTPIDAIVVLGAGYRPAPKRPLTGVLSSDAVVRVAEAVRIARTLPDVALHCTCWGGGQPGSNAAAACELAIELGVEATRVHIHPEPRDTAEEAAAIAASLLADSAATTQRHVLVVSDATHLRRARFLLEQRGMRVSLAPTGHLISDSMSFWLIPSATSLAKTSRALHEWLGLAWAHAMVWSRERS